MIEINQNPPLEDTPSLARSTDRDTIPIVLGVAGHIDLDREHGESIRRNLRRVFDDFRERYPHTERVLLSSLAAGSDQLAAEVALECGAQLVVALPFPARYYARSSAFKDDPKAGQRMLELVGRSGVTSFVIPLPELIAKDDAARWNQIINHADERRRCYANAGGYVTRHCQALIALWNGQPPEKPSGTSEMVNCKLLGTAPALYPWPRPLLLRADGGPVYVVHTPRLSCHGKDVSSHCGPGALRVLLPPKGEPYGEEIFDWKSSRFTRFLNRLWQVVGLNQAESSSSAWRDFHGVCQMIDDYNAESKRYRAASRRRIAEAQESRFWEWSTVGFIPTNLLRLITLRETAAVLAGKTERPADLAVVVLFLLLFAAGVSFHLYAHWEVLGAHTPLWLAFFLLCLFAAGLLIGVSWYLRWNERSLDYRSLAEALRVRIYWAVAGIGDSVSDTYLGQLRSEMVWVRRALQSITTPSLVWERAFDVLPVAQKVEQIAKVAQAWVDGQVDFFKRQFHKHHSCARSYRRFGFLAAGVGWLLACMLLTVWPFFPVDRRIDKSQSLTGPTPREAASSSVTTEKESFFDIRHPSSLLLVLSGSLVLGGGLLVAYCERRSHEELAKQYERMTNIFLQGQAELHSAMEKQDIAEAQEVLRALGQEAILENAQWLVLKRNRPFELLIF